MYRVVNSMLRHSNIRAIASSNPGHVRPLSATAHSSSSPSFAYASTIDASNEAASSSSSAPSASSSKASPSPENQRVWGFFKFFLAAASTGAIATAGYATYAYSTEEVEEKAAALRRSANYNIPNDASTLERIHGFLYSTTMSVPAKAAELYLDIRRSIEEQVKGFAAPSSEKLLPDLAPQEQNILTLVLDLNETLVYSDWKRERGWRTFKRPGVDAFLEHLAYFYEIVVFSDQLSMYVEPIMERLDQKGCVRYRLSRDATQYINGKHYRDLSKLNRDPAKVIYLSGHAGESCLQAENAIEIRPWKLEPDDTSLLDLIPFLEYLSRNRPADIRPVLSLYQGRDIATEFRERTKEHQRRMQEQKQQGRFWRRAS